MKLPAQTMLHAQDLDATIAWYRDVLGFSLSATWPDTDPTWCAIDYGPATLMFTNNPADGSHESHMSGELCFYPDDIDRYYDEVTARGAQAIQPPADQVFGMRTFLLTDPNGYTLMFAQGLDELDR
ncbi:MAG TPA: VOC family protein [Acidimicrobiia bacterium]|nr:VOC family protein [Acidimicrobiia bacterium]